MTVVDGTLQSDLHRKVKCREVALSSPIVGHDMFTAGLGVILPLRAIHAENVCTRTCNLRMMLSFLYMQTYIYTSIFIFIHLYIYLYVYISR